MKRRELFSVADGVKIPILRAEFCYESFVMYALDRRDEAKPVVPTEDKHE